MRGAVDATMDLKRLAFFGKSVASDRRQQKKTGKITFQILASLSGRFSLKNNGLGAFPLPRILLISAA